MGADRGEPSAVANPSRKGVSTQRKAGQSLLGSVDSVREDVQAAAPANENERKRFMRTLDSGDYLATNFGKSPVIAIFCFNPEQMAITDSKLERPSVVGGGSVYPAVENLLLACRTEGLGCVLTTLLCQREPEVCDLLGIPKPWGTAAAIPIGYPVGSGHGPLIRRSITELSYLDTWGKRFS